MATRNFLFFKLVVPNVLALRPPVVRLTGRPFVLMAALPPHLQDAQEQIARGDAVLLDVREPDEWSAGHFASARALPYNSQLKDGDVPADLVGKTVYIHCKAGGRAVKSAEKLQASGIDAVAFKEGFDQLRDYNFAAVA